MLLTILIILLILCGDIELNPGPKCNFKIAHLNIRSITAPSRLDDVENLLLHYHNFDILALTETHLDNTVTDNSLHINGYQFFRRDRNRNGGGVGIYIKETLQTKRRFDLEQNDIEIIWIETHIGDRKFLISSCYRPPGQNLNKVNNFLELLQLSLESAIDENPTSVLLLGDLNDRCTVWNSTHPHSELKDKLVILTNSLNFSQLINDPTRGNNILDILLTNTPDLLCESGVYPPLFNLDHCTIYGILNITYLTSSPYTKQVWKLDECNYENLNDFYSDRFNNVNDTFDNLSLDACVCKLTDIIIEGMEQHVPSKIIKIRPMDKPWFTPQLRKLFQNCYRLHKRKNRTKRPADIDKYLEARRLAKTSFKESRKNYYDNLNLKIGNPETTSKTFWKLLKSLFNKNHSGVPTLNENGTSITNDLGKAEALNMFFASQSTINDIDSQLPPFTFITDARLDQINITEIEVRNILTSLTTNKSTGSDKISNKLLKECAESLCAPLTFIFRLSLQLGIFPDSWKEALITAIFKKIDPSKTKNYRPISLLSCISKVFEKVVFNHTYPYLENNNLLPPHNSGFRHDDSAINRIIAMLEEIYTGLDQYQDSLFVSLDISKAFDRVWHKGLLFKLKQLGITGNLLNWFASYLSNRCQRVVVGGQRSSIKYTNAGVPQGSILGPMLFLVYIYDMCKGLSSGAHQFADDTTLIFKFDNIDIAAATLNSDLMTLDNWATQWKVIFNPSKTLYMIISNRKRQIPIPPLYLCGEPIQETNQITTFNQRPLLEFSY